MQSCNCYPVFLLCALLMPHVSFTHVLEPRQQLENNWPMLEDRPTAEEEPMGSPEMPQQSEESVEFGNLMSVEDDCPGCARDRARGRLREEISEEELRQVRIEMIKERILSKMRLQERPNITFPAATLPEPLLDGEVMMQHDQEYDTDTDQYSDQYGKTEQMVVFGNEVTNCFPMKPAGCFRFALKERLRAMEVHMAELWVYKLRDPGDGNNQTMVVSELGDPNHSVPRVKKLLAFSDTALKRGWMKFDMKHAVRHWLTKPNRNNGVEISCKTCLMNNEFLPVATKGEFKPFIVIRTEEPRRRTKRRAGDCKANSRECCREQFYVSFEDIGWNDWLIQPAGYYANFCRGSCSDPVPPRHHHLSVMREIRHMESNRALQVQLAPCCAPTRLSAISIMYYDDDMAIIKKNFADMKVESCGCT